MALPATSSPSPPLAAHADWLAEHTQHTHRNTPSAGQKRRHEDVDDKSDTRSSIASGLKRLRINPHSPTPQRPFSSALRQQDSLLPPQVHQPALPNSSAFPTSHPAYLQPQHPTPLPSPLNLTPGKSSLAHYLSPHSAPAYERNYTNTPPPQSLASSSRASTWNDAMALDHDDNPIRLNIETPSRIVINDLDAELAEIEAEEEQQKQKDQEQAFFLPDDVEKEISSVPQHVLRQSGQSNHNPRIDIPPSQALILYKTPTSLTIPEEEDAVRRAVREARERIREKREESAEQLKMASPEPKAVAAPPWPGFEPFMPDDDFEQQRQYQEAEDRDQEWDPDAMEIE